MTADKPKLGDFMMKGGKPSVMSGWINGTYEPQTVRRYVLDAHGNAAWQAVKVSEVANEIAQIASKPSEAAVSALRTAEKFTLPASVHRAAPAATVVTPAQKTNPWAKSIKRLAVSQLTGAQ